MALAMANMKNTRLTLRKNQTTPGIQVNGGRSIGDVQPPRNRIVVMAHIRRIEMYSPSMNSRYGVERIFDHEAGDELGFAFGQIEGRAVGFGERRDVEHHEHREQRQPEPVEERQPRHAEHVGEAHFLLRDDDVVQVQRADAEQHGDDDEADRDFVGHHLRGRTERAEEGYFEFDAQPPMMTP